MKKYLAIALATLGLAFGVVAVEAIVNPAPASALIFAGSCGWSTATGSWHWSSAYGVYYVYHGHVYINGHYWREFLVYSPVQGWYQYWYVYCG